MSKKAVTPIEAPKLMAFTVSTQGLLRALEAVAPYAASGKTSIEITRDVLVVVEPGRISLTTTDLESYVTAAVLGKVQQSGAFAVLVKDLKEAVTANKTSATVTIRAREADSKVEVEGTVTCILDTLPADDFPAAPDLAGITKSLVLEADSFRSALDYVAPVMSRDETRPTLSTLNLHLEDELVSLEATDSYRICVAAVQPVGTWSLPDSGYMLPERFVRAFARQAKKLLDAEVHIDFVMAGDSGAYPVRCIIHGLGVTWISRVVDGQFPKITDLVPGSDNLKVFLVMQRSELEPVLRSIAKTAAHGNAPIRVGVGATKELGPLGEQAVATLSFGNPTSPSVKTTIPAFTHFPDPKVTAPFEIGFNPDFFLEACRCERQIGLAGVGPLRPMRIVPDEDYTRMTLLMPIRLNE
jgi:DNA polymerase-3 subunit beta